MRLILFFIGIVISSWAFAQPGVAVSEEDCTNTDIRDTNPLIRNNPEVREFFSTPRDQDSIGWCYAFAASDLMTAVVGTPVSAMHASIIFNSRSYTNRRNWAEEFRSENGRFQEVYEGGWAHEAIEDVRRNGWVCTEEGLPFDAERPRQIEQMIIQLEGIKRSRETLRAAGTYTSDEHNRTCQMITEAVRPFNLPEESLLNIADSLLNKNMNETLDLFARSVCSERIQSIPQIRMKDVSKRDNSEKNRRKYMQELNRALNGGKPIQLSYRPQTISTSADGSHASIIIGRRWNNGRCEYNIRNSWGRSCASYHVEIDCNREEGTFWMSDQQLFEASSTFRYVR